MRTFLLLCLVLVTSGPVAADELQQLLGANRLLQAELDLSRKDLLYLVFDLQEHAVLLKTSGVVAARLPISRIRFWGPMPAEKLRILVEKLTPDEPQRDVIRPESVVAEKTAAAPSPAEATAPPEATTGFELKALELADMPGSYRLVLDDGTRLTIRPDQPGFPDRLAGLGRGLWWALSRPLISDWYFIRGKTYTEVLLTLPLRDARLLYWSFVQGSPCLIRLPQEQP